MSICILLGLGLFFSSLGEFLGITEPENPTKDSWFLVFAIVIVAPIIEELIFRFPMRYSNKRVAVLTLILFVVMYGSTYQIKIFDKTIFWIILIIGISSILFLIYRFKDHIRYFWITHFKWIYWGLSLVFGLIHLGNYVGDWQGFAFYWPVLCLHQTFTGLLNGYARMRYGFLYGLALHAANNCVAAIFLVIDLLQN
jgi:hypothetical protein